MRIALILPLVAMLGAGVADAALARSATAQSTTAQSTTAKSTTVTTAHHHKTKAPHQATTAAK